MRRRRRIICNALRSIGWPILSGQIMVCIVVFHFIFHFFFGKVLIPNRIEGPYQEEDDSQEDFDEEDSSP